MEKKLEFIGVYYVYIIYMAILAILAWSLTSLTHTNASCYLVEMCSMMQLDHLRASSEHRDMYFDKKSWGPENAPNPYIYIYIHIVYIYIMYI